MRWRLILICSFSLLLLACQEDHTQGKTSEAELVVMPVEYYSGAAINNVMIEVYDEAGERIGAELSYEGEAVFRRYNPIKHTSYESVRRTYRG